MQKKRLESDWDTIIEDKKNKGHDHIKKPKHLHEVRRQVKLERLGISD